MSEKRAFDEIKNEYVAAREQERLKIVEFCKKNGYDTEKSSSAGKGKNNYTSGGKIAEYDLRNWKYAEVSKDSYNYFISLQAFDNDPNSHNHHVLMDRIGICAYSGDYDAEYVFNNMTVTDIDLPLTEEKLTKLEQYLKDAKSAL